MRILSLLMVVAVSVAGVHAQVATGNIRGTVTDSSEGVISNVKVTILRTGTGAQRIVSTNERGDFDAPLMPLGDYQITAEIQGFQKKVVTGINLQVDQTAVVRIVLEPGAVTQTVEVTGAAPLLESQTSSLGQVIENRRITELPLNGRNPFALGMLAGGAIPFQGLSTNLPIVAGGGRHSANDILLDGVDNNIRNFGASVGRNGFSYTPSVDAVQEFKVKTNNFSAEYGRSAGFTMNATIRSGTNEVHGSVFEFLRNDKLDANNFVSNYAGQRKAKFRQNQFGATLGGPVRLPGYSGRDRTFFFTDYEGTQVRQAAGSSLSDVAPASFRKGDFSRENRKIYDPASRQIGPTGVVTAEPFPGNALPASRMDAAALKYQNLIPLPNVGGQESMARNYLSSSPRETSRHKGDLRIDHRLFKDNHLMFRFSLAQQSQPSRGTWIYSPSESVFNTRNAALSDTHLFGSAIVNEFRFGFNRANTSSVALLLSESMGFAAANGLQSGPVVGFPTAAFTYSGESWGASQFSNFSASSSSGAFENAFQWSDNLSIIRGSHTLKMGGEARRFRFDRMKQWPLNGTYYFGAIFTSNASVSQQTGLPFADFLLGLPTRVVCQVNKEWSRQRDLYVGGFIQDDWRLTRRLTFNLGFRYDLYTQPVDALDHGGVFDPYGMSKLGRRGVIRVPGQDGFSRAIVLGHHKNLAPRFGFAYEMTPRFVVRGGYGIFYTQREQNDEITDLATSMLNQLIITTPPVTAEKTVTPPLRFTSPLTVESLLDPDFSKYNAQRPLGADSGSSNGPDIVNSKFPMLQQFNLSLQYEFVPGLLVEGSYAGARGVHWVQRIDMNQVRFEDALSGRNTQADRPFPFVDTSMGLDTSNVGNWYHSFNLRVERRFSRGLTFLANYTASKNVESGNSGSSTYEGQGNTRAMDTYNLKLERGLAATDCPQKLVLSALYELPFGPGQRHLGGRGLASQILGGWQVNGILMLRSGFPTDARVARTPPVFTTRNRPNLVLGQPLLVANPGFDQYFNPKAFEVSPTVPNYRGAPIQTFGNAGRTVLRGPGSKNLDLSLFKEFRFSEKRRLEFRTEAFNFSNTPTFRIANARSAALTVGDRSFGKLTGSQSVGRQIQFGLKFLW